MTKFKTFLNRWLPVLLWAGIIFFFSSQSSLPSAQKIWWDYLIKKFAHMGEYAVFYYLLVRAFNQKTPRTYLKSFIITILYAISDEIHQGFTPGRHPGIYDVYYDSLGALIAYLRLSHRI